MDGPVMTASDLELPPDTWLHPSVVNRSKTIPCFTTPAPTDDGRAPPKRQRGTIDPATRHRWLSDARCFAPWQYQEHAMLSTWNHQFVVLPPEAKEQLHGFRPGYTAVAGADDRSRHRMIANSWHLHVVRFLLLLLLQLPTSKASVVPCSPKQSTLQQMISLAQCESACIGPGGWNEPASIMPPAHDMWCHWRLSSKAVHPIFQDPQVEPGIHQCFQKMFDRIGDLPRLRREVVSDIRALVDDWSEHTQQWYHGIPGHVASVYGWPHSQIFQVPVFLHLLEQCNMTHLADLTADLTFGFDVIGELHQGPGWLPRTDDKYQHPISFDTFKALNSAHVRSRLQHLRPDPHWQSMLDELLQEKAKGRLEGPFSSPAHWPVQMVGIQDHPLQPLDSDQLFAAMSFSVEQVDKVRRIEDWSASFHNQTIQVSDVPTHHSIQHFIASAQFCHKAGFTSIAWGHDLNAAYRQLAVRDPTLCHVVMSLPQGHTLWRHNALSFGSTAAVWSFNRLADMLVFLARKLLLCPAYHYVDDFSSIEPVVTATSGFESFADLFALLGLHMKEKKAQPPAPSQRMLGVFIQITNAGVQLTPCPDRVKKIIQMLDHALETGQLSPSVAQKVAGKINFLNTALFGHAGAAALHCVYTRSAGIDVRSRSEFTLSKPLRTSLIFLRSLLSDICPRWLPFHRSGPQVVVYTDAFFQLGDLKVSPHDTRIPHHWSPPQKQPLINGWGVVIRIDDRTMYAMGSISDKVLRRFGTRKAFIYFLEIVAQVIVVVFFRSVLPSFWLSFIDNQAGCCALLKGYGRDDVVNHLLSFTWSLLAKHASTPHFHYVPSDLNVADSISRGDDSDAVRLHWQRVHLDLHAFEDLLLLVADDLHFATTNAVDMALQLALNF